MSDHSTSKAHISTLHYGAVANLSQTVGATRREHLDTKKAVSFGKTSVKVVMRLRRRSIESFKRAIHDVDL
jgi:hypothetical protein